MLPAAGDAASHVSAPGFDDAMLTAVQGWMAHLGPTTASEIGELLGLPATEIEKALLRMESSGTILRGSFRSAAIASETEWCDRRLLARIHRLTVATLRKQIAQVQLMPKQVGETDESRNAQALGGLEQVLEQSEGEGASGRMVVHLRPLDELTTSQDNVLLEDQDQIVIPRRPSAVSVLGQVYHPTALVYQPELTLRDYLDRAGGPTEGADEDHIYVFKADGSILTDDGLKNGSKAKMFPLLPVFSGGLMSAYLEPGDVVYVPEQLVFSNNLEVVKDVSQIIASAIQTIAVVALVATTH